MSAVKSSDRASIYTVKDRKPGYFKWVLKSEDEDKDKDKDKNKNTLNDKGMVKEFTDLSKPPTKGGKTFKEYYTYKGRKYLVRKGKRGGRYIMVKKEKIYITKK